MQQGAGQNMRGITSNWVGLCCHPLRTTHFNITFSFWAN